MSEIVIAGEIDDLFSHMTLLGLASIVEDAGGERVRVHWNAEEQPVLGVAGDVGILQISEMILRHAEVHSSDSSWLRDRFEFKNGTKVSDISVLGPRTASPTEIDDWRALEDRRQVSMGKLEGALDCRFVQGLGYRSWWHKLKKQNRPDKGANIWEMKTRNKGGELIRDRLLPLAEIVGGGSIEGIEAGILGHQVKDVHGSNQLNSRTPTGFSVPRPTDNVRAWCALWGLGMLPVMPMRDPSNAYPSYLPRRSLDSDDRHQLLMPVPNSPISLVRMRGLLRSNHLPTGCVP